MKEILDIIKNNSGVVINENTTIFDISPTQEILNNIIDEKYNSSLAYNIANVIPLKGTWGSIYASKKKNNENSFEVVKKDIHTKSYTNETDYSWEVIQDMRSVFGSETSKKVGNIFSGISSADENFELLKMIDRESDTKTKLLVDTSKSGWIISQISQKVSESILEMNKDVFRTMDSFCILPSRWAAYYLSIGDISSSDSNTLFVGRYGRTDFYVNPINNGLNSFNDDYDDDYENGGSTINYCYVGLKDQKNVENNSIIFAPYQYELQEITDPETYKQKMIVYNRYGLTTSPLHTPLENKSMLYKFKIEELS